MKKQAFLFFALAMAFALAPSLEAQIEIKWGGRTLVGWESWGFYIDIEKAKFGGLYSGGDRNPNVVEIMKDYSGTGTKTTVDKIGANKGGRQNFSLKHGQLWLQVRPGPGFI